MAIQLAIKESGLFYYIYSNTLCLSSTSNVLFPLRFNTARPLNESVKAKPSCKFVTTLVFLVANAIVLVAISSPVWG